MDADADSVPSEADKSKEDKPKRQSNNQRRDRQKFM